MESGETSTCKRYRRCDAANRVVRFTVVEQNVPLLLPVEEMVTLQAGLDLDDNGDKVIFLQFGGESSLRTLKRGHMAIRADQFDPDGWQLPEKAELRQNNDQGVATNYMSAIAHLHQRPRCTDDNTPAGDTDAASTLSRRPNFPPSSKSQHGLRKEVMSMSARRNTPLFPPPPPLPSLPPPKC